MLVDYIVPIITSVTVSLSAIITTLISNFSTKKELTLQLLRLQIMSRELPIDDRLKIYDQYKKMGGNSWIETYVETILKKKAAETWKNDVQKLKELGLDI